MNYSLGIIGRTADGTDLCDGQTIKTRILRDELIIKYPNAKIINVDTYNYKKRVFRLLRDIVRCMKESQLIFILLSRNGRRVIFPIVFFLNIFYNKKLIHDVIGGGFFELIKNHKEIKRYYLKFDENWVESLGLKKSLENIGVNNVEYIPNFKRLNNISIDEVKPYTGNIFKFCIFSRVNEAKGIGRAAQAIIHLNKQSGHQVAALDIYGPIEDHYDEILNQYIDESNGAVAYKGVIPSDQSVEVLKPYYALLFPTTFSGEGFPGTLIDAFSSGIPVIATDWHLNSEIIKHGVTGYIYDWRQEDQLIYWIEYSISHPDEVFLMKMNCIQEAEKYSAEVVMEIIVEKLKKYIL